MTLTQKMVEEGEGSGAEAAEALAALAQKQEEEAAALAGEAGRRRSAFAKAFNKAVQQSSQTE